MPEFHEISDIVLQNAKALQAYLATFSSAPQLLKKRQRNAADEFHDLRDDYTFTLIRNPQNPQEVIADGSFLQIEGDHAKLYVNLRERGRNYQCARQDHTYPVFQDSMPTEDAKKIIQDGLGSVVNYFNHCRVAAK